MYSIGFQARSETVNVVMHCLMGKNNLSNPNNIRSGDSLYIPDQFMPPKDIEYVKEDKMKEMRSGRYVVRPGDTLSEITQLVKQFKGWSSLSLLTIEYFLCKTNSISNPNYIQTGQSISIIDNVTLTKSGRINAENYTVLDFFLHASDPNTRNIGLEISIDRIKQYLPTSDEIFANSMELNIKLNTMLLSMFTGSGETSKKLDKVRIGAVNIRKNTNIVVQAWEYHNVYSNGATPDPRRLADWVIGNITAVFSGTVSINRENKTYTIDGTMGFYDDTFDFDMNVDAFKKFLNQQGKNLEKMLSEKYHNNITPVKYSIRINGYVPFKVTGTLYIPQE